MMKKKKTIIISSSICLFVLVLTSTYYWADWYMRIITLMYGEYGLHSDSMI